MRKLFVFLIAVLLSVAALALDLNEIFMLSKLPTTLEESVDQFIAYVLKNRPAYRDIAAVGRVIYAKRELRNELREELFRTVCAQDFDAFLIELSRFGRKLKLSDPKLLKIIFPQVDEAIKECLLSPNAECLTKLKNLALVDGLLSQTPKIDIYPSISWSLKNALRIPLLFDEVFSAFIFALFGDTWFERFWSDFEAEIERLDEADYPKIELLAKHLKGKGMVVQLIREYMATKLTVTEATGKVMLGTEEDVKKVIAELPEILEKHDKLKTKKKLLRDLIATLFDMLKKRLESVKDPSTIRVEGLPSLLNVSDPLLRKEYYDLLSRLSPQSSIVSAGTEPDKSNRGKSRPRTVSPIWFVLLAGITALILPPVRYWFYTAFRLRKLQLKLLIQKIQRDPANGELHLKLGRLYESLGMYEDAIQEYSLAVKLMKQKPKKN